MNQNASRPTPPDLSDGCFNCGAGNDCILESYTRNGASVALCVACAKLRDKEIALQPYNARGSAASHVN